MRAVKIRTAPSPAPEDHPGSGLSGGSKGGGGVIRAIPPPSEGEIPNIGGQHIGRHMPPPQANAGHNLMDLMRPAGSLSGLRGNVPIRNPWGRIRARGTDQDPLGRAGPRGTNQGPAERVRIPEDESGPPRTNQGSAGRIRAPRDGSRPAGRIRAHGDEQAPRNK